jgi:hypothetical protein
MQSIGHGLKMMLALKAASSLHPKCSDVMAFSRASIHRG